MKLTVNEIRMLNKMLSILTNNITEREQCSCTQCKYESAEEWEMPCARCKRNCTDMFVRKDD